MTIIKIWLIDSPFASAYPVNGLTGSLRALAAQSAYKSEDLSILAQTALQRYAGPVPQPKNWTRANRHSSHSSVSMPSSLAVSTEPG
ncbi:MAG: hypothetical protein KME19_05300 [Microcoleus vaginatus WJT46-NPBG5]|nr:hypothetical protein [Microcoleus vaginatus WJT46-NPBG5]